jgi:CRP-like cAMP-binding protein
MYVIKLLLQDDQYLRKSSSENWINSAFSSFSCSWQVIRLQEEFFLPGEVILEQGSAVDQIYFVCHGALVS